MSVPSRFDLSPDDLTALLDGEPTFRTRQVWEGLDRHGTGPSELPGRPRVAGNGVAGAQPLRPVAGRPEGAAGRRTALPHRAGVGGAVPARHRPVRADDAPRRAAHAAGGRAGTATGPHPCGRV